MSMPALSASLTYEKNALFGRRRQDHGLWLGAKVESRCPSWYLICRLNSQENELTCKLSAILVVATIVAVTLVALARAGDSQTQEKQVPWL